MDKYTWEGDDLNSIDTSAEARLYCPAHGRPFTYRNIKPSLITFRSKENHGTAAQNRR